MKNIKIFIATTIGKIVILSIIALVLIPIIVTVSVVSTKKNQKSNPIAITIPWTLLVPTTVIPPTKAEYQGTFITNSKDATVNLGIFKIPDSQKNLEGESLHVNNGTISYGNITSESFSGNLLTGIKFTTELLFHFDLKENSDKTKLILTLGNDLPLENNIKYNLLLSW